MDTISPHSAWLSSKPTLTRPSDTRHVDRKNRAAEKGHMKGHSLNLVMMLTYDGKVIVFAPLDLAARVVVQYELVEVGFQPFLVGDSNHG